MTRTQRCGLAALLIGLSAALRTPLEAHPVPHVLVQMPALVLAGALLAPLLATWQGAWHRGGWACLITALGTLAVWMLPRSIDAALADVRWELAKFITLVLLAGVPLAAGWARAHPLLRGFLQAQAVSMCGVLAFLYLHAPQRLCISYLEGAQRQLGLAFVFVALALTAIWVSPLVVSRPQPPGPQARILPA